ncbi:hypothetical protein FB45DRAFT_1032129 [Roridomyces roridus]|uniref:Uncharacterized protein n=1 Tax=Roridomyces roridus TaxID=1738132 RepID=A0AAD7BIZ0_9AGAR|nr:hypothetical protein FB45DRAFT_1032129 [Roridomyces roridus]
MGLQGELHLLGALERFAVHAERWIGGSAAVVCTSCGSALDHSLELQSAHDVAHAVIRLETLAEGHLEFLRTHIATVRDIHTQWSGHRYRELSTLDLADLEDEALKFPETSRDVWDRYRVMSNCMTIAQRKLQALALRNHAAFRQAMKIRCAHYLANANASVPAPQHPLAAPGVDRLRSDSFTSEDLSGHRSSPISLAQVRHFKKHPEELLGVAFRVREGDDLVCLRVSGRTLTRKDRGYFLVKYESARETIMDDEDLYAILEQFATEMLLK